MIILGLDPGSTRVGYGFIQKEGGDLKFVRSGLLGIASGDKGRRLLELEKSFSRLLKKERPDLAVLEKLYFAKNQKTGLEVAQSRGILTLLIIKHKIPLLEYTPSEIKSGITGYGRADKKTILKIVAKILRIKKIQGGDDAADALAAAIVAANRPRFLEQR